MDNKKYNGVGIVVGFMVFLFCICYFSGKENANHPSDSGLKIEDGVGLDQEVKDQDDYTEVPVYKTFTVSSENPNVYLGNPEVNQVYFSYRMQLKDPDVLNRIQDVGYQNSLEIGDTVRLDSDGNVISDGNYQKDDKGEVSFDLSKIKDGVLYDNDAVVEPGRAFEINIKELLPPGEYDILIDISTYDMTTEAPCNGATQEVKLIVK